jgi:S-adenosylmethionine/arginine decarboxylase-like enzyme
MLKTWGKELIINAHRCNLKLIACPKNIELFSGTLVKKIDMVAYGKPLIQYFGHGNKAGYTLVQLIETSNITGHYSDDTGDAYLNIFSCKDFDEAVARAVVIDYFKPELLDSKVIYRQAGVKME